MAKIFYYDSPWLEGNTVKWNCAQLPQFVTSVCYLVHFRIGLLFQMRAPPSTHFDFRRIFQPQYSKFSKFIDLMWFGRNENRFWKLKYCNLNSRPQEYDYIIIFRTHRVRSTKSRLLNTYYLFISTLDVQ